MRALTFFRPPKKPAPAGPPPAEMRARAAEINDPSPLGWEVLWEALKTEPPTDEPSTLTQELGLDQEQEIVTPCGGSSYATEFSGTRHGRCVAHYGWASSPASAATATTRYTSTRRSRPSACVPRTVDPPSRQ